MTVLVKYEAACRALAEAKSSDEVRDIRDTAEAMRAYARIARNRRLEIDAAEIRIRAERRVGELMRLQRQTVGLAKGRRTDLGPSPTQVPTLIEAGIDKHLADRARKLAAVPADAFEAHVAEWRERGIAGQARVTTDLLFYGAQATARNFRAGTGEFEWYTPAQYVEAARRVMGAIDLDPATHPIAQRTVRAEKFFTAVDDGLRHEWLGRVWLNPPYAQPLIVQFIEKLLAELASRRVSEAILLTHNYTDTSWFHTAARVTDAICFTRGRIKFIDKTGTECAAPAQGQAFFYFGTRTASFRAVFGKLGIVLPGPALDQELAA
jgi:phage N-6-adenine-methyltransferase